MAKTAQSNANVALTNDAHPSAAERANVAIFDEVAQSLGLTAAEARPRRWISRIGTLLRLARAHKNVGQRAAAESAQVTQPYLSRLESGLLPTRGPTIDVLLRCIEAADCNIEIAIRSKKDGELLGHVSSADLDRDSRDALPVSEELHGETEPVSLHWRSVKDIAEIARLIVQLESRSPKPGVVWVGVKRDADGHRSRVTLQQQGSKLSVADMLEFPSGAGSRLKTGVHS